MILIETKLNIFILLFNLIDMVMGVEVKVNKVNSTQSMQTKRDELFKENSGKIVGGVKYPYTSKNKDNGGVREFNKIFLTKGLKQKLKDYTEKKKNDEDDELFNELIK